MAAIFQRLDSQAIIAADADAVAQLTAKLIVQSLSRILARKQMASFIPSSGSTPLKTYRLLATDYKTALDWSRVSVVQMDEYASDTLDRSLYFRNFLTSHLVTPLGIKNFISIQKPNSQALNSPRDYANKIAALGRIDFALHGIGRNGHIGFNEPGSSPLSETRMIKLAPETRRDNFPDMPAAQRPHYGMTMGLKDLKNVRHTLLIATGAHKTNAVRDLLNRSSVEKTPACALWETDDFGIIIDRSAAGLIRL